MANEIKQYVMREGIKNMLEKMRDEQFTGVLEIAVYEGGIRSIVINRKNVIRIREDGGVEPPAFLQE